MLRVCLLITVIVTVTAQVPIPKRPLGFTYANGSPNAPVLLDAYMGPLCSDSVNAFPNIKDVANFYGPQMLRLRIHLFPLPYHRNSFLTAKGIHIVNKIAKGNATYTYIAEIYKNLDPFFDRSLTEADVISKLAVIAKGFSVSEKDFIDMMSDPNIEEDTRVEWKYTCTRGISGTPMFTVNDVIVLADPTWTVADWRKVLDPLYGMTNNNLSTYNVRADCKVGTKTCEYLPGKIECCTKGEACIPNVGCRC